MRHWLFHPLALYPLLAVIAAGLIWLSMRPDLGALAAPTAQSGRLAGGAVVLDGAALAHPDVQPGQVAFIARDGAGRAVALRLAVEANQPPPGPADPGARILLDTSAAAALGEGPVTVEVTMQPVPVTTAAALAVSLQGAGPVTWVTHEISPQAQILRFEVPGEAHPQAVGLRAISEYGDYSYGLEITRIRLLPAATAPGR